MRALVESGRPTATKVSELFQDLFLASGTRSSKGGFRVRSSPNLHPPPTRDLRGHRRSLRSASPPSRWRWAAAGRSRRRSRWRTRSTTRSPARPCPASAPGSSSPTTSSMPPASRGPTRSSPVPRGGSGRRPRKAASCASSCSPKWRAATPRCSSPTTDSRSTTAARKPSTRARCPKKAGTARTPAPGARCRASVKSKHKIAEAEEHAVLSGAIPSDVAGQPTYTVHVAPEARRRAARRGRARLGRRTTGRRCAPRSTRARRARRCCELEATDISFEAVSASVFDVAPPPGAKVVNLNPQGAGAAARSRPSGSGVDAVAEEPRLPARRRRRRWPACRATKSAASKSTARPAALVTYGKGLGGIAVIESAERTAAQNRSAGRRRRAEPAEGLDQRRQRRGARHRARHGPALQPRRRRLHRRRLGATGRGRGRGEGALSL